jgi:superfamily II DNA/RNA helicase
MQLIRCTKKLQKEMGLKQSDLCAEEPRFSYLGSWHANLILIDRRKCIVFVNDKTLFNFIAPDASRAQIRELEKLFKNYLSCVIADEGMSEASRVRILSEYNQVGHANTNSKGVLGAMNDLAFHYKFSIEEAGGVHSAAVPAIKLSIKW